MGAECRGDLVVEQQSCGRQCPRDDYCNRVYWHLRRHPSAVTATTPVTITATEYG